MNRIILTILITFGGIFNVFAQNFSISGDLKKSSQEPLNNATIIIKSKVNTFVKHGVLSETDGSFIIKDIPLGDYILTISHTGYSLHINELKIDKNIYLGDVILHKETLKIDEVVVTTNMIKTFADKREYKLSNADKERYSSALSALDFLPEIQVTDLSVSSLKGKSVKILINGVPSSPMDLSIISSSNIEKIEYYTTPPIQYSNMGIGTVINITTKRNERGGVIGLNTLNALTTGFGNNVVNFKYNFKNSQVGLMYNINYRKYDKRILDEELEYTINNQTTKKDKIGENSPYAYEDQAAELIYNNSKPDNYLFSTKLSLKSFDRRRSSTQNVVSYSNNEINEKKAESIDNDSYFRPVVDIYFNKSFNKKHDITMNVVGTYYSSLYNYAYNEAIDNVADFETSTDINSNKYSVIGDAVYGLKLKGVQLSAGARYMFNSSNQSEIGVSSKITTNEIYSYIGAMGKFTEKINYNFSVGVNSSSFTTSSNNQYHHTYFRPSLKLGYLFSNSSELSFNYDINTQSPTVGMLTYNPYFKDLNYLYAGNPNLKSSNSHDLLLSYFKGYKKFVLSTELTYSRTNNAIVPYFTADDENVIESFQNIDYSENIKASLFLQWYPLNNNKFLRLRLYSELFNIKNECDNKKWDYTGYILVPSILLFHKKWDLQIRYQSESKVLDGHILKTSPSMAMCELSYKVTKSLSATVGVRYPFYDAYKVSSSTYASDIITRSESERILDNANMVHINLVYNFSFGKKNKEVKRKLSNEDRDTGILNR